MGTRVARDVLAVGWKLRGTRLQLLRATLALAVDFHTWETLAEKQGLDDRQAAKLMSHIVAYSSRPPIPA